jgi:hypothetical protein
LWIIEQVARVDDGIDLFVDSEVDGGIERVSEIRSASVITVLAIPKMCVAYMQDASHEA